VESTETKVESAGPEDVFGAREYGTPLADTSFDADDTASLVLLDVPPKKKSTFFTIPRCDLLTSEDIDAFGGRY